ncbi:DUF6580 family putative transport protein [Cellulomonas sp. PhB143]|uniref:DUF6580 family putative transport protein n=1 Tax=Cellulomonas sp. PhB143 TaxID=2485186 RepID=UPI000F942F16|nr:DUF6580 family putative transport protein [Cellulomonas sp. PhB143]ROS72997.1 hypothetical protein EDF32_2698 [Cellulomonas sp. PhB143]
MEARDLLTRWWRPALVVVLVALAIAFRMAREDLGAPPNLELVTAATFASALLLRHPAAFVVPLVVTMASDIALGNTAVAAFTWSAWAVVGLGALWSRRFADRHRTLTALGFGVGASLWFYLWTNAGVWWLGRGTYYPPGLDGLVDSYVAGLPFLRTMLLGNLVLVPAAAALVTLVERLERLERLERGAGLAPVRSGVVAAR